MRIFNAPHRQLVPSQRDYPPLLREMVDPPDPLYVMGEAAVLQEPMLAIVGTRKMSAAASRIARELIPELVAAGFVIVSGLARGVDTLAHEVALASGGKTVAVLGSGLDDIYPHENRDLALRIAKDGGAVLTEYVGATPPEPWHFPARNRIIAGLSRGTWVLEAPRKSGALITAEIALELGREVFATPGSIFDKHYEGCHSLLQQGGAKLVMRATCILEEFGLCFPESKGVPQMKPPTPLTCEEEALLTYFLPDQPLGLDQIVEHSGKSIVEVSPLVTQLCTKGWLKETAWNSFLSISS